MPTAQSLIMVTSNPAEVVEIAATDDGTLFVLAGDPQPFRLRPGQTMRLRRHLQGNRLMTEFWVETQGSP